MRLRGTVAATALIAAVSLVSTGASYAEPAPIEPGRLLTYEVQLGDNLSVSASVDYGYWQTSPDGKFVTLVDDAGKPVESIPTQYDLNGRPHPIPTEITDGGQKLQMKPQQVGIEETPAASNADRQAAWDTLMREIVTGWNNQGPVSTAIGAAIGFGIGCLSIFPNFIAGCIIGTIIGAGIGAAVGVVQGNPNVQPAAQAWIESFFK
ncbi:hypothetical protein [Antrihabitans sp. YC2-6]|uniref:hypothetical protein n=1 Tax=Antrihabitans sp. YC2-6 TaxID=2799498 RepID=UPI0018F5C974|nr:hypothetical protein [Antrihabitans sp. YC2-6]MBJ8343155.1 hypothetical protein [Antrihabitans sp. YC2-6]